MLLVTFSLGAVTGGIGLRLYERWMGAGPSSDQALLADLSRTLRLSSEQRSEVEEILKQSRLEYQELRNQNRPQFHAVRDRARQRIKGVLSSEQQRWYDEWNREQDERREQQRSR